LRKQKEEIEKSFVVKGESREAILMHDLFEIDGNHQGAPFVGALGGFLGQIIIACSSIQRNFGIEGGLAPNFLKKEVLTNFLFMFVDSKMKQDKIQL